MIEIRKSNDRGHFDHGWLNTYHTFSFGQYLDPRHVGFRTLRVINEDRVQPGAGFGEHPHRDMEIISYVLEGELAHCDSMGNSSIIRPGDVQRMTAGTGIRHSEFNNSSTEVVHFLQIWIVPDEENLEPGYEQKTFSDADRYNRFCLLASPDGRQRSLKIHQDVLLYGSKVDKDERLSYMTNAERYIWIQVARGSVSTNSKSLGSGDGMALSRESLIHITADEDSEILLFDLA